MNLSRVNGHRAARACGLLAAAALVTAFAPPAGAAVANAPAHGSYSFTDSFVDDEYCAFPLEVTQQESAHYTRYFNADGSDARLVIHVTVHFTIEANGRTLSENDRYQLFITPDGSTREVGLHTHTRGEHGLVLRDAGHVLFNPDGSVAFIRGPHPQFLGADFCDALA
jgi:hypothetical protein